MEIQKLAEVITLAEEKMGSRNALAEKLRVNIRTVAVWKEKKGYPNEKTMIRLARIIKYDETIALVELCYWKANGKPRKLYRKLLEMLYLIT